MINYYVLLVKILLIYIISIQTLSGQNLFDATAVVGANFSQIDGDNLIGYDKAGLTVGLKLRYPLNISMYANMELLYSQRGSQATLSNNFNYTRINYAEIPIYVSLSDWYQDNDHYHKVRIDGGVSLGYLVTADSTNDLFDSDLVDFRKYDISLLGGIGYSFSRNWAISLRYTHSLIKIIKKDGLNNTDGLVSYFITLRTEYTF